MAHLYSKDELAFIVKTALSENKRIKKTAYTNEVKQMDDIVRALEKKLELYESDAELELLAEGAQAEDLFRDLYVQYRRSLFTLSNFASVPYNPGWLISETEAEDRMIEELDIPVDGIYVFREDGAIYIRVPLLPHKNKPFFYTRSGVGASVPVTATRVYGKELYRVLRKYLPEVDLDAFAKKTLQYLYVYSDPMSEIDSDNRDTTGITNAICAQLPGGDAPTLCRFVYDSVRTDVIPQGTYVTVTPKDSPLPENEGIIGYWAAKIASGEAVLAQQIATEN